MSRVAKNPISIPPGLEVSLQDQRLRIKGDQGCLEHSLPQEVEVKFADNVLSFSSRLSSSAGEALAGTTRAVVNNMVHGIAQGFEKRLTLVGVGYRAQIQDKVLNLTLGFSHPVNFDIPDGIVIEALSQTEIVVRGIDKQKVGQVAANIRAFRPPEPYKGKGIKYADEVILMKEAKKK